MPIPNCLMCDDTGFKDHAAFRMEPCDHLQLPPLPDLLPCPNPNCDRSDPQYRSSTKGAQYVMCYGCGLSVTEGGQHVLYATWNGLLRISPAEERQEIVRFIRDLNDLDDDELPSDLDEIADRIERQDHRCQCMEVYGENPDCPVQHETDGGEYGQ